MNDDFLTRLPKAELHLHIEGTLEPELMFALAERNGVTLPYASIEAARKAYDFSDLQSFLDLYYQGMSVLVSAQDFEDLAMDYFRRAAAEGVVHVELHVDPQAHRARGVTLDQVMTGLTAACARARTELDLSSAMILAFLRDQPAEDAMQLLEDAQPYLQHFSAVGLDSAEQGNPPSKFREVFARARELGLERVAHAGEEGPPSYIREALDELQVCRIDHGVRAIEDIELVERLADEGTVLTVCPLSNVRLKVVEQLEHHSLPALIDAGLVVTINSDDPAYFGGGMRENFAACQKAFGWSDETLTWLASNAIEAAFMDDARREELRQRLLNL
ncbi:MULTISPECIES: adenosine deaminase [unclassified Halomonas]|uniref:adenosine deaminase n=1 Tax=unclassified Halomonas TaxID=2609666 RepID=UPI001C9431E5|nr:MULTISPECIES: adenosine deaminase [unclassified Halomonas]MBY5927296.1 adenosine deaminase [Halomonas sp. DP4Y7-2]MBY6234337.1 adenosine deaminase [Halomonas sp. DP4Y7-1]MED5294544.1 adenosine deaminase [Pseudomonadota bacterium]